MREIIISRMEELIQENRHKFKGDFLNEKSYLCITKDTWKALDDHHLCELFEVIAVYSYRQQ